MGPKSKEGTNQLFPSCLSRPFIDVGFSPGESPPATVKKRKKLIQNQQRCFSHDLQQQQQKNYPDNSLPVEKKRRKQDDLNENEALFGPIPTIDSFCSVSASFLIDDDDIITNPNNNDDDVTDVLTDEMVFQELDWISNTMNSTSTATATTTSFLPPSPPLSPFDFDTSLLDQSSLDDFVLFP